MIFADTHIHLLCGVDDGPKTEQQMQEMLDAAYADGTRYICVTPHFHPGYFGDNSGKVKAAFTKLQLYAEKYGDLELYLGNELRYGPNCMEWLESGQCMPINGSRYLLVDFAEHEKPEGIVKALLKLINYGYIPVLAHAERYVGFHRDLREIKQLQECGVLIQVDAQSPFGSWGRYAKTQSKRLIKCYFADIVASDAHDVSDRPPQMSKCYKYAANKCGVEYARKVFLENPLALLNGSDFGKEMN